MVATARPIPPVSPSLFLGERPHRVAAPPDGPPTDHQSGPYPRPPGLTALAAAIEHAPGDTASLAEADLPEALRCRTALLALARRADRRGKEVALSHCAPEVRAIAGAAGWNVAGAHVTRQAAAISRAAAAPATRGEQAGAALGTAGVAGRAAAKSLARRLARQRTAMAPLVGVAALALAALLVPSATVTLTPATQQVSLDLPIVVDPGIKKPDVAGGRLPGRAIDKEVAQTAELPTTGRKPSPDARAAGEVVFVNKTDKPVVVPKGTIVLAGNVRFATQADLNVSGTIFSGPQQRISMQRVPVQAVNGGSDGNVGRFQINKIDGPLAGQLDVQNDAPTRAGSEKTVSFVTADDRRKLQESLTRTVTDRLDQQLKSQLPSAKETAVPWSPQNPTTVEMTFSKNEGDEAQTLSLTMKVRYGATVFGNEAYNAFVKQAGAAKAAEMLPGFDVDPHGVSAEAPEVQGIENGAIRLQAHAKAPASAHLDAGKLRAAVANQPLAQAQAHLSAVPGVTQAGVQAWPGWLGRTPPLGWRIAVRVAP